MNSSSVLPSLLLDFPIESYTTIRAVSDAIASNLAFNQVFYSNKCAAIRIVSTSAQNVSPVLINSSFTIY